MRFGFLSLVLAASTSCVLFHDDPGDSGGSGADVPTVGGGGGGGAGAGGAGAAGAGAAGAGGDGGGPAGGGGTGGGVPCPNGVLGDAANCAACGHACGGDAPCIEGTCGTQWVTLDEGPTRHGMAVVQGSVVFAEGLPGFVNSLRPYDTSTLLMGSPYAVTGELGIGFLKTENGQLHYAVQVRSPQGPPLLIRCDPGLACVRLDLSLVGESLDGRHVNGFVWRDDGLDLVLNSPARLFRSQEPCLSTGAGTGTCTIDYASDAMDANPPVENPIGLAIKTTPQEELWWLGYRGADPDCVVHLPSTALGTAVSPLCEGIQDTNSRVFASGSSVFIAMAGSGNPVRRVMSPSPLTLSTLGGVESPFSLDANFLFATDPTPPSVVARALSDTSTDAARVALDIGESPVFVDATHPLYVFFMTVTAGAPPKLHRWRKPPPSSL